MYRRFPDQPRLLISSLNRWGVVPVDLLGSVKAEILVDFTGHVRVSGRDAIVSRLAAMTDSDHSIASTCHT